jgi:hypothetical protein
MASDWGVSAEALVQRTGWWDRFSLRICAASFFLLLALLFSER